MMGLVEFVGISLNVALLGGRGKYEELGLGGDGWDEGSLEGSNQGLGLTVGRWPLAGPDGWRGVSELAAFITLGSYWSVFRRVFGGTDNFRHGCAGDTTYSRVVLNILGFLYSFQNPFG